MLYKFNDRKEIRGFKLGFKGMSKVLEEEEKNESHSKWQKMV